jgi:hypothetical protein
MSRINLRFDRTFSKRDTFWLREDGRTIRCRISEASSEEVVIDLDLRYRLPRAGALKIQPIDASYDTWWVESAVIHPDLARVSLQLSNVPPYEAGRLLAL